MAQALRRRQALRKLTLTIIAAGVLWTTAGVAKPPGPSTFCATYPASPLCSSGPPACALCHDGAPPARNLFGAAIGQALLPGTARPLSDQAYAAALPSALRAIESSDSDSDGTTNFEEIASGTLPGSAKSTPGAAQCPPSGTNPAYDVCHYDARYVLRKVSLDFCGEPPSLEELERISELSKGEQAKTIDDKLTSCIATEFWAGKNGQVWQLANSKIRPIGAFKGGPEDRGFLPIADYYNDFRLWAYSQTGDSDCREVITGTYWVGQTSPTTYARLSPEAEALLPDGFGDKEGIPLDKRAGLLTSRWTLLYSTMFAVLPRGTAAQAVRAFLDQEIAQMEGLTPVPGEPVDYDKKGVAAPTCAACHSTLDPLAYAFRNYNGFTGPAAVNPPGKPDLSRAAYYEGRMDWFNAAYPGISNMPSGFIFGQPVGSLMQWAQKAADSDQFARARVNDYWRLLMGQPSSAYSAEYAKLWQSLKGPHDYRIVKMLRDLVRTEAYGAP
jgi:hypothetical protein